MQGPFGLPGRHLPPVTDWIDLERRAYVTATAAVGASVTSWQQITVTLTDPFVCTGVSGYLVTAEIGYGPDAGSVTPVLPIITTDSQLSVTAGLPCVLPPGINHLWLRCISDANAKAVSALHGFYAPGAQTLDRLLLRPSGGSWIDLPGTAWVSRGGYIVGISDAGALGASAGDVTLTAGGSAHSTLISIPAVTAWGTVSRGHVAPIRPVHVPTGFGLGYGTQPATYLVVSTAPGAWSPLQIQGGLP